MTFGDEDVLSGWLSYKQVERIRDIVRPFSANGRALAYGFIISWNRIPMGVRASLFFSLLEINL